MKKTTRMFLTGACSALVAWIIIHQISPEKSTIGGLVGSILSFFLGYISWEFEVVLNAIKNTSEKIIGTDWKKIMKNTKEYFVKSVMISILIFTWIFAIFSIPFFTQQIIDRSPFVIAITITSLFMGFVTGSENYELKDVKRILIKANPFSVFICWPLWLIYKIPTFIRFMASKKEEIKEATKSILEFLYNIYREIHTYFRLAVGFDSLIGFSIGYFLLDNILIGALISGTLVVINYYIIGIKILKLKPAEIS